MDMKQIQIKNTTYLIHHVFSENHTAADLIGARIKETSCQALPLTAPTPIAYNTDENQSAVRSSK